MTEGNWSLPLGGRVGPNAPHPPARLAWIPPGGLVMVGRASILLTVCDARGAVLMMMCKEPNAMIYL